MSLYSRLLLGYGVLFSLLLLSAVGAAVGFHDLGNRIGSVLEENFDSVQASMQLLASVEEQDRELLSLLFDPTGSRAELDDAMRRFRDALGAARSNITIPEEGPVLDRIEARYIDYVEERDRMLAERPERPLAAYESRTLPLFEALQQEVRVLLDLNHQAMREADRAAQRTARTRAATHGLLVGIAALALVPLARAIGRGVLDRLTELSDVASDVAAGDAQRRVRVERDDELGRVGQQFNALLDRQLQLESDLQGRLNEERMVPLGLVGDLPYHAAVLSRDGRPVVSTLSPSDQAALHRAIAPGDERLREDHRSFEAEIDGISFQLRRLTDPSGRDVGWIARRPRTEAES